MILCLSKEAERTAMLDRVVSARMIYLRQHCQTDCECKQVFPSYPVRRSEKTSSGWRTFSNYVDDDDDDDLNL